MEPDQNKVGLKEIIKAFKLDCLELLFLFTNTKGKTYEDFVKLWLKGGYNLCLVLHKSLEKIRIFNTLTLEVGKELLFANTMEYSKLGALYLLYLLFDRQFKRCGNHIKLTHKEFKLFSDIIIDLIEKGHEEVHYVYNTLEDHLFFMVSYDNPLGYELVLDNMMDKDLEETDITNETLLTFFDQSYTKYKEAKDTLSKMIEGPDEVLNVIETSCNVIDTNLEEIKEFLTAPDHVRQYEHIDKEETGAKMSKRILKQKAMELKNEPKHTRSHKFVKRNDLIPELPKRLQYKKRRCMGHIFEAHGDLEELKKKENEAEILGATSKDESEINVEKKSMPILEDISDSDKSEIDPNSRSEMMEVCSIKSESEESSESE